MADQMIQISRNGEWVAVPGFKCQDKTIIITGRWVRTTRVHDEAWSETELPDPESCLDEVRRHRPRADVFTFAQKPPGHPSQNNYRVERESTAIIKLTTFDEWWTHLPQETRKNVRRSERHGVTVKSNTLVAWPSLSIYSFAKAVVKPFISVSRR